MSRPHLLSFVMLGASIIAGAHAEADLPDVLDRVPIDGPAGVIALRSLQQFDDNTSDLLLSIEADAVSTFGQMLGALGLRDGLDMRGSAAGVVYRPVDDAQEDSPAARLVLIFPVTEYAALREKLRAESIEGSEVDRFEFALTTYYSRALAPPYAVFSADRELIDSFPDESGFLESHVGRVGDRGARVAESSDVIVISGVREVRPLLAVLMGPLLKAAPSLPIPGALSVDDPRTGVVRSLLARVQTEGIAAMLALSSGPLGVKVDIVTNLQPDGELAKLATAAPRPQRALDSLPALDAMFAGSINLTHAGWRTLIRQSVAQLHEANGAPDQLTVGLARSLVESLDDLESASVAIYRPQAVFNGLLTRTAMRWQGERGAPAIARSFWTWLEELNESERFIATVDENALMIGDTEISRWKVIPETTAPRFDPLFGASGTIHGSLFTQGARGGMIWGEDDVLLGATVNVDEPLGRAVMLEQVSQLLPDDRVVEWYLDIGPVLSLYGPMLAVMTGGQPLDIPQLLPPIGASASLSDGALHATLFVPAPLIKFSVEMIRRIGAAEAQQP